MEIVLLRHGLPKIETHIRLSPAELGTWVSDYNEAALDLGCPPPDYASQLRDSDPFVVCSTLRRSLESAHLLGFKEIGACEAMFRELELPVVRWQFPKLSVRTWIAIFRLIWVTGYFVKSETIKASLLRAQACTQRLVDWANVHQRVVFVGHGALNWCIARELKTMGWSGPQRSPRNHWDFGVYRYEAK